MVMVWLNPEFHLSKTFFGLKISWILRYFCAEMCGCVSVFIIFWRIFLDHRGWCTVLKIPCDNSLLNHTHGKTRYNIIAWHWPVVSPNVGSIHSIDVTCWSLADNAPACYRDHLLYQGARYVYPINTVLFINDKALMWYKHVIWHVN